VLIERDGQERLYFVVETKSSLFQEDLRDRESSKIKCGTAHFQALAVGENPAIYGKFKDAAPEWRIDQRTCRRGSG
jgi:type III restriction enzyme